MFPPSCGVFNFWTFHAQAWTSFSGRAGHSGTLGFYLPGSNRQEVRSGLPLGPGLSVPTVLQTLRCVSPGPPGPRGMPVRGPCWSVHGTEGGGRPARGLLTPAGCSVHRPCSRSPRRTLRPGALGMEEVSDGLRTVGDRTTAESVASQAVPAVVGAHAIKLGSPGHTAQSTALRASGALLPPWQGGFPTQRVSPGDQAVHKGRGLASGTGREVEKGSGPGACGQRQGRAPVSPLLLPGDKAPRCWAPPSSPGLDYSCRVASQVGARHSSPGMTAPGRATG